MWVLPVILICVTTCVPGILSTENTGKLFITAFPENVAFYDPVPHISTLFVTALRNNTLVTITVQSSVKWEKVMDAATIERVHLDASVELQRSKFSNKAVVIRSTKDITVQSRIKRNNTRQFVVLQPVGSLGSLYYIPILTQQDNLLGFGDFRGVRGKIVIINSEGKNTVKVNVIGHDLEQQELVPFQVLQLNMSDSQPVKITAEHNVAVLLTHPCANITPCNCQIAVIQLRPAKTWGTTFLVPSAFANAADNKTNVIVTSDQKVTLSGSFQSMSDYTHSVHDLKTQYLSSSGSSSVMLIQPGTITELIPESSFSACYFIPPQYQYEALVIVPRSNESQVHLGKDRISNVQWQPMDSQRYLWTIIELPRSKSQVIWHPSTKIAVYVKNRGNWGEATSLSKIPAPQGCLVDLPGYFVDDQSGTWAETISHCKSQNSELVSINSEGILQELSQHLSNPNNEKEVWVGLRRRLVNGEWYWLNKQPMNITKWVEGQPGGFQENFCASMSLSSYNTFGWKSQGCCHTMKPVCYKKASYFPVELP